MSILNKITNKQTTVIKPAPPVCHGAPMVYQGKQAGWCIYVCQKCGKRVAQ